jgi:hypothetical protein
MTKKTARSPVKKKTMVENIHSINNQEFRYPSLIQRLLNWMIGS